MGIGGGGASEGGDGATAKFKGLSTSYYVTTTLHTVNTVSKIYDQLIGTPIQERDVTERVNCGKLFCWHVPHTVVVARGACN